MSLIAYDKVMITVDAVKKFEEAFGVNQERVFQILLGPHVSEKAAIVTEQSNQYVFRVSLDATKDEIRQSVEQLFKVTVNDVQTLRVKGKTKRNRYGLSKRPSWKKAYVRVEQGQEIDFASMSWVASHGSRKE